MATITYDSELMPSAIPGKSNQTTEINSYTINLSVLDSDDFPLSLGQVVIGAAPNVDAVVNGVSTTLTSPGHWFPLDASGSATLIVQAQFITSSNFWVTGVKDNKNTPIALNPVTGIIINPSHKVISALGTIISSSNKVTGALGSSINDAKTLSQLRGQSGNSLWTNKPIPSNEDLNLAAQVLKNTSGILDNVHQNQPIIHAIPRSLILQQKTTTSIAKPVNTSKLNTAKQRSADSAAHIQGASATHIAAASRLNIRKNFSIRDPFHSIMSGASGVAQSVINGAENGIQKAGSDVGNDIVSAGDGIIGIIEGGFHSIFGDVKKFGDDFDKIIKDIEDYSVQESGNAWHFAFKVKGDIKKIAIKTIQDLSDVLNIVWGKLKLGIHELIDFAGFLFEWDDIKSTAKFIEDMLNATLEYGKSEIGQVEGKVNTYFTVLKNKVDTKLTNRASPSSGNATAQISTSTTKSLSQGQGAAVSKSPALNFLNERYQNNVKNASMTQSPSANINKAGFRQSIMPSMTGIEKDLQTVVKELSQIFKSSKSLTNGDLWKKLAAGVIDSLIDIINLIIQEVLKGLTDLITAFKNVGNAGIHIPILSDLLGNHGFSDLSVFDLICLLLGFMVTVAYKLVAGKKLTLPSADAKTLIQHLFKGDVLALDLHTVSVLKSFIELAVAIHSRIHDSIVMGEALIEQGPAGGVAILSPATMSGPFSIKSLPSVVHVGISVLSSVFSLRCSTSAPGYEFSEAASIVSFINTIGTTIYTFTATGEPEEVQALEDFYIATAVINFALYEGVAIELTAAGAEASDKTTRDSNLLAAEQCLVENLCNTVASFGQYVGMTTAAAVDETVAEQPEAEVAEAVAIGGFAVYCAANDALLVNKAVDFVSTVSTEAKDVVAVAANP